MMTTCVGLLKLGRGVRLPVRFLASRPDKKQHDRYAEKISGKTVSRIVKETKEDEMLDYEGSHEVDPLDELLNTYELRTCRVGVFKVMMINRIIEEYETS